MVGHNVSYFETPSYVDFVYGVSTAYKEASQMMTWDDITPNGLMTMLETARYSYLDVVYVLLCALLWTILRLFCSKVIFQKIVSMSGLRGHPARSIPESLWKLTTYAFAWLVSAQLVLYKYKLFDNPLRTILGWDINAEVPFDIYLVYLGQISFYVHSIYATIFMDKWRKDSIALLTHHFATIFLIGGSYLYRYMYIGMLVLFLHDINDVVLEVTKIAVYYKSKGGRWAFPCEIVSNVGFVMFGCSWFLCRLYWFPLRAIYVSLYMSRVYYPEFVPPFWFPLNTMLLLLLVLHTYWFKFIVEMAIRVITGKTKEVEDVREFEEDDKNEKSSKQPVKNGYATKKHR